MQHFSEVDYYEEDPCYIDDMTEEDILKIEDEVVREIVKKIFLSRKNNDSLKNQVSEPVP